MTANKTPKAEKDTKILSPIMVPKNGPSMKRTGITITIPIIGAANDAMFHLGLLRVDDMIMPNVTQPPVF
jgi:hypothetical protein